MSQETSSQKLTRIAREARERLFGINSYNPISGNEYNGSHPNATQESGQGDPLNIRGKGTGQYLDTTGGGGEYDINGLPQVYNSGRKGIYSNVYSPQHQYEAEAIDIVI